MGKSADDAVDVILKSKDRFSCRIRPFNSVWQQELATQSKVVTTTGADDEEDETTFSGYP